jgi:hypothetical protein
VVLDSQTAGRHQQYSQHRWALPYVRHVIISSRTKLTICAGGDRFDDRQDQEALLDVLVQTENDHARPTAAIQKQMKESWGWISE